MKSYVLNLNRRPERYEAFKADCQREQVFLDCQRWEAPDAQALRIRGMDGCKRGHIAILEDALKHGHPEVCVFEDDAFLVEDFKTKLDALLTTINVNFPDWQCLFLGGQHQNRHPPTVADGLVKALEVQRTHAYIVKASYIPELLDVFRACSHHIDRCWSKHQADKKIYCAEVWLAGQRGGRSDIALQTFGNRIWQGRKSTPTRTPGRNPERLERARQTIKDRPARRHRWVKPKQEARFGYEGVPVASHYGDLGDLIYCMPALRTLGVKDLVLYPAPGRVREPFSEEKVKRLWWFFHYQGRTVRFAKRPEGLVLDGWRKQYTKPLTLVEQQYRFAVGDWHGNPSPWLTPLGVQEVAPVVINRTPRYHGKNFPWRRVVEKWGKEAVFVGLEAEHRAFCSEFGEVKHYPTSDLEHLFRVITGAKLFIGNQSTPLALAHGLDQRVLVEEWAHDPNCHLVRLGAHYDPADVERINV